MGTGQRETLVDVCDSFPHGVIKYKSFRIVPDRLYPTFTGWFCYIYHEKLSKFEQEHGIPAILDMAWHTRWIKDRPVIQTMEEAIELAKIDIDNGKPMIYGV